MSAKTEKIRNLLDYTYVQLEDSKLQYSTYVVQFILCVKLGQIYSTGICSTTSLVRWNAAKSAKVSRGTKWFNTITVV